MSLYRTRFTCVGPRVRIGYKRGVKCSYSLLKRNDTKGWFHSIPLEESNGWGGSSNYVIYVTPYDQTYVGFGWQVGKGKYIIDIKDNRSKIRFLQ